MSDSSSVYNEVFDPTIHDNPTNEGNTYLFASLVFINLDM